MPELPPPAAAPQHEHTVLVLQGGGALGACPRSVHHADWGRATAPREGLRVFDLTR